MIRYYWNNFYLGILTLHLTIEMSLQLDVQYRHPHAVFDSSIGLNPSPLLEFAAAVGSKDLYVGAEVGFNTQSASFTKYNAGITFNKPDYSVALIM